MINLLKFFDIIQNENSIIIEKMNSCKYSTVWITKPEKIIKVQVGSKGSNNPMFGRRHSEETKKLIAEKCKNSKRNTGKTPDYKTRAKIAVSKKGIPRSQEVKDKISKTQKENFLIRKENNIVRVKKEKVLKTSNIKQTISNVDINDIINITSSPAQIISVSKQNLEDLL